MLRVAFATSDGAAVDQHFGRCDRFDVYDLTEASATLVRSRIPAAAFDADSRTDTRLAVLRDCAILHITEIGGPAAARVVNAGIHPLKVADGTAVADLTVRLSAVLGGNPPPWLRKVLRQHDPASAPVWSPR
jgi:nitrogen fixation protein NifX